METIKNVYNFEKGEHIIGQNSSTWSYNDDYSSIKATLIVNVRNGNLKLVFTHLREKYGLGAGSWFTLESIYNIGNIKNYKKSEVRRILKENQNGDRKFGIRSWYNRKFELSGLKMDELIEKNNYIQRMLKIRKLYYT